jgi:transposase InsO family protein
MPFKELAMMDLRKQMVLKIQEGELTVTAAAKSYGVTRKTVQKWLHRCQEVGLDQLAERSRRPLRSPRRLPKETVDKLLELKDEYSKWGAKKLVEIAQGQGTSLSVRSGNRIFARHGLVTSRPPAKEPIRFEREAPNLLYQMDFKGLPNSLPFAILTVVDDASRMCPLFKPIRDKTGEAVFEALWEMFEEVGLPESFLMDNGDCWGGSTRGTPTAFEAKLWRLGIQTRHGRPRHPQTQGKVERFHQTAKFEMGDDLLQADIQLNSKACEAFRQRYNWIRPHESLNQKPPGSLFQFSARKRPDKLPEPLLLEGVPTRRVDAAGRFSFKGNTYRMSKGLIAQTIQIKEDEFGLRTYYAGFPMIYLKDL